MMKHRAIRKLASKAGESIGETLVALLISALALMMLAGAVSSGMNVVEASKKAIGDYYIVNNAVVARDTDAPTSNGSALAGFGTGTLNVTVTNLLPGTSAFDLSASYWKNEQLSGVPVIAYGITPTSGT